LGEGEEGADEAVVPAGVVRERLLVDGMEEADVEGGRGEVPGLEVCE